MGHLFKKGLECVIARLLHLPVDVAAEFGHDLKQGLVVVHQTAAELSRVLPQQPQASWERETHTDTE